MVTKNSEYVVTVDDEPSFVVINPDNTREIGQTKDVIKRTGISNTYPAIYNHVIRNANYMAEINGNNKTLFKKSMRGGRFFFYRFIVFLAFALSVTFTFLSVNNEQFFGIVPLVLSVIYITLSIYNIIIYRINRPLLHPNFTIPVRYGLLGKELSYRFYDIPLRTNVRNPDFSAVINDSDAFVADLKQRYTHLTEVRIMLYDDRYLRHNRFAKEAVFYLVLFILILIVAIFCAIIPYIR
jgi:hypothetical protein